MEETVKLILLTTNERLVSQIDEVGAEIGEPDCRLTKPCKILENHDLSFWMSDDTDQREFMISSDKIITIAAPNSDLLEKYLEKIN